MQLVSIIIPCYNYGWILHETLDSLLKQTYPYWEALVIDDGSTDNTAIITQQYAAQDDRFRYFYQPSQGVSAARNTGLRNAVGSFVQFLDADDLLESEKLRKHVAHLSANPNFDIVYGDSKYFNHDQPQILSNSFSMQDEEENLKIQGSGLELLPCLLKKNSLVINTPLLSRHVIQTIGMFNTSLTAMEDWEFWLRCALANMYFSYDNTKGTTALVRVHKASASQHRPKMTYYELCVRENLQPVLLNLQNKAAYAINEVGIEKQKARIAAFNISEGSFILGLKNFISLGWKSHKYMYYFKSLIYWSKKRLKY